MYFFFLASSLLLGVVACQQPPGWDIDLNGLYYTPILRDYQNGPPALLKPFPVPPEIPAGGKCFYKSQPITDFSRLKNNDIVLCYTKTIRELSQGRIALIDTETVYKIVEKKIYDNNMDKINNYDKSNQFQNAFYDHYMAKINNYDYVNFFRDFQPMGYFLPQNLVALPSDRSYLQPVSNSYKSAGLFDFVDYKINSMIHNSHLACMHNNKSIPNLEQATPQMLKNGIECKFKFTKQVQFGDSSKTYLLTEGNFKIIAKPQKDKDSSFRGLAATTENPKAKGKGGKGKKVGSTTPKPSKNGKKGKTTIKPKKTYKDGSKITTTPKPITDKDGNVITTTRKPGKKGKSTTKIYKSKLGGKKFKTTTKPPKGGKHGKKGTTAKPGAKRSTTENPVLGGYRLQAMMDDDVYKGLRQGGGGDWRSSIKERWNKLSGVLRSLRKHKGNSPPSDKP